MTLLDMKILDLILILVFLVLPIALIYGKVKQISITLEQINRKIADIPKTQPEPSKEDSESGDSKYYPTV